jgi:anti-sigma factor RsiW
VTCELVERNLDAYVDREIDVDTAELIRQHLPACGSCRRRVDEIEALGRLVRAVLQYAAPGRLRAQVARSPRAWTTLPVSRIVTWAAAAAVVFAAGAGFMGRRAVAPAPDSMAEEVVSAHVRSLMPNHLFDVESTDQHTVKPWFLGKLDFAPPVVDLAAIGYPLIGGRLDYVDGRAVAALVYQRRKHTINVFIEPAHGTTTGAIEATSRRGFHVRYWTHDEMAFWAVSDLADPELSEFARGLEGLIRQK